MATSALGLVNGFPRIQPIPSGSKNYLSSIVTSQTTAANTGNGNFELGNTNGWSLANTALSGTTPTTVMPPTDAYTGVPGTYVFTTSSANATVGAVYTNNGHTFTIVYTVASSLLVVALGGNGSPTSSGTLTKSTGTGDSTITFSAVKATGANGNLTLGVVSSGQLSGSYSGNLASSTASTAGDMLISNAFYIDSEDQAKVMTVNLYYKVVTNNGLNFSGTSSNSFAIYIYDVTNGAWIMPAGTYGMTQSSGVGHATATFQATSNSTQYQLAIVNLNASSGAYTLYFDDFSVGPQTAPIGAVVTDWQSFTPTGSWTSNTTYTGEWRRVGDSIEVQWSLSLSGAPTAATLTLGMPSGITIDTTKLAQGSSVNGGVFYNGQGRHSGSSYSFQVFNNTANSIGVDYVSATTGAMSVVNATAPVTWGSGDVLTINYCAPVVGWSSNVQMSTDSDTRVVSFMTSHVTPTGTINSSTNPVIFPNNGSYYVDTHGEYNSTTGVYTVPVTGYYNISTLVYLNQSGTISNTFLSLIKNGSAVASFDNRQQASATFLVLNGSVLINCNAGDTLQIEIQSNTTTNSYASSASQLFINRLSGPSVVAATEATGMRYTDTSGASIGTSLAVYKFQTQSFDSHGGYSTSTGLYTCPSPGYYSVKVVLQTAQVTLSTTQVFSLAVYKNGSLFSYLGSINGNGANAFQLVSGGDDVPCNGGDTLGVYALSSVATTASTTAGVNHLSICKTGKGA